MFIRIRRLYINCYDCQVEKELGMKVKVEREGSVTCFKNWMPLLRKSSIKGEIGPIYHFWYLTTLTGNPVPNSLLCFCTQAKTTELAKIYARRESFLYAFVYLFRILRLPLWGIQ